jgi:glycosyltransferase involved in cell wall biosynthesis
VTSVTTISVCIPVRNGGAYLAEALDSVLAQSADSFAVHLSDNASTDDTPAIVERYAAKDDRIHATRSDKFLAQADSINRALDGGEGDWLKPLCHDDLLEPACVERLQEVAAELPERVGLVGHGESHLFANGYVHRPHEAIGGVHVVPGHEMLRRLLDGSARHPLPSLTTALVRRSAWQASDHFDRKYSHSDTFCWARMLTAWDYAYVDIPLTVNRIHGRQVAVAARASHRSTREHDQFWNAFVDEFGEALRLSRPAALKARLRGAAAAGSAAAIQLLKGQPRGAVDALRGAPPKWWPFLPVLTARAYAAERSRIRELRTHVPVELIYP